MWKFIKEASVFACKTLVHGSASKYFVSPIYIVGQYFLVMWPEEASVSVVCEDDIASPELHSLKTGVDCKVKAGRSLWSGRVAAVGKFVLNLCLQP